MEGLQPRALAAVDDELAARGDERRRPARDAPAMQAQAGKDGLHVRIAQQPARIEVFQGRSRQRSSTRLFAVALAFQAPAVSMGPTSG